MGVCYEIKQEIKLEQNSQIQSIKSIKSFYIIGIVFSFLQKKKKLEIIKNNKKLQRKFEIDIEYYKEKSGKYKVMENETFGKEYKLYSKRLIFEGYYIQGKKNGEGKDYYDNGNLEFVGKYLNGYKITGEGYDKKGNKIWIINNGKGEEYYKNGTLKFKGEYFNELRWNGKGYNPYGSFEYKIKNGKGKIKEYYDDIYTKLLFEGECLYGKRSGKGKEFSPNGDLIFEGEYYDGQRWKGIFNEYYISGILKFEGEYKNGEINGRAKEYDVDGELKFEGEYLNGKRNGKGKEYYDNGNLAYEGDYLNGKRNGKGKEYYDDGNLTFEGEYVKGKRWNGKGNEYFNDGRLKFEGDYLNGKRWDGIGKEFDFIKNLEFDVSYFNGKRCGIMKKYNDNRNLIYQGDI